MIARYSLPEMAELWSDEARYTTWARVEALAARGQSCLGRVPEDSAEDIERAKAPSPERVRELERDRDHEVLSFLAAFCENVPAESARWVHLGMTSYDLVDTALGATLARASDVLVDAGARLRRVLVAKAFEHRRTVCVGRTHGVHAEPTTFGHKLAVFAFAADRSLRRLRAAREAVAVGTISGSVGTYSQIDPLVEAYVCGELGLGVEPAPTQVVARDRHAELVLAVASLGACVEQIAVEFRLLQRTEVREVEEPRTGAYQGSSAMPHKRNPTTSERLCGLARLLRGHATTVLEDVALWHERDLAHSPVERVVLPDSLTVGHYQVSAAADLVEGLEVFPDRMRAAVDATSGLVYSSAVLTDLLEAGTERERAYRLVQAAADRSARTGVDLTTALGEAGVEVAGFVTPERSLVRDDVIFERLEGLDEMEG
ncbi:adenylosuccinate lyase [Actinomadura meridiana]|uniref:Adenylosuccinate lyase n=1 Tax=Actinomadura meridiana TaxID=559626 RepID=A0ABP8BS76_9ACTN